MTDEQALTIIQRSHARSNVHVQIGPEVILAGPHGTMLESFLQTAITENLISLDAPVIAAISDGELVELSQPVTKDSYIAPVTLAESDGGRIYRRSLVLLLAAAVEALWPHTQVSVKFAVRDGGFYCEPLQRGPFSADELAQIESKMRQLVAEDLPITKREVSLDEARQLYAAWGAPIKVRLLDYRDKQTLPLYRLNGYEDYYFGYMVPSTRYLQTFKLVNVGRAFILQYPLRDAPTTLHPLRLYKKLSAVFQQADDWLHKLNVRDIGRLNALTQTDDIQQLMLVAEALHEQDIAAIASQISIRHANGVRIVLIAGPSSSGKTTFAKRLAIQLLAHGLQPFTVEMDHYFVDRDQTPLDEQGEYDFESIYALNRKRLNDDLLQLMAGQAVQLPRFNFHTGHSEAGRMAQVDEQQILILEGIHGLNPELVPKIPQDRLFRIYVSALTQLNLDRHNRIPTTDVRLLRRIVRDARTRGYSAANTLDRWSSVGRGERRNIFPYQENADVMFNSALVYELAALRSLAEPLLLQVQRGTPANIQSQRLLSILRWVLPLSPSQSRLIPDTSLLREFIGGSLLDSYHPGVDTTLRHSL